MKRRRVSISLLMAVVVVAALNFSAIRGLLGPRMLIPVAVPAQIPVNGAATTAVDLFVFALGVLPMASLLSLCALIKLLKVPRQREPSSFLIGFEVFGWSSVILFILAIIFNALLVMRYVMSLMSILRPPFLAWFASLPPSVYQAFGLALATVAFTLPELLVALCGGWLTSKLGIRILKLNQARPSLTAANHAPSSGEQAFVQD